MSMTAHYEIMHIHFLICDLWNWTPHISCPHILQWLCDRNICVFTSSCSSLKMRCIYLQLLAQWLLTQKLQALSDAIRSIQNYVVTYI